VIDGSARQEIGFSFDDQSPPSFPDKQSSTKTTSTTLFHPARSIARLHAHSTLLPTTFCSVSTPTLRHLPGRRDPAPVCAPSTPTSAGRWHQGRLRSSSIPIDRTRRTHRRYWLWSKVGGVVVLWPAQAPSLRHPPPGLHGSAYSGHCCCLNARDQSLRTCQRSRQGCQRESHLPASRSKAHTEGLRPNNRGIPQSHSLRACTTLNFANSAINRSHFKMGYEDSVYLAKLAEQAERYEGEPIPSEL
jgi:hypothetical protein